MAIVAGMGLIVAGVALATRPDPRLRRAAGRRAGRSLRRAELGARPEASPPVS